MQTCSRSFYFIRRQPCQRARARLAAWLVVWPEGIWRQPCQRARARLAAWLVVWPEGIWRQPCQRARARLAAWLAVWPEGIWRQPCQRARARLAAWLAVWYKRRSSASRAREQERDWQHGLQSGDRRGRGISRKESFQRRSILGLKNGYMEDQSWEEKHLRVKKLQMRGETSGELPPEI